MRNVEIASEQGKRTVQTFNFNFECKKWYFIAVSHMYHFIRRSEASLFVDAKLKGTALLYITFSQPLIAPFLYSKHTSSLSSIRPSNQSLFRWL